MKRLAVFELTGCGGCDLNIIFLGERLIDLLELYEISHFQMMSSRHDEGFYDVAIVTGSVSSLRDREVLIRARESSEVLLALGTCAIHGGPQGSLEKGNINLVPKVYGKHLSNNLFLGEPVSKYVKVDFSIPGCPCDPNELFSALVDIAHGVPPQEKDYPVCLECKINEYECVLLKRGIPCLGPITVGGCNAACLRIGAGCIGCRGPLPKDTNFDAEYRILLDLLKDDKDAKRKLSIFSRKR